MARTSSSVNLMPEVAAFLESGPLGGVIGGKQVASSNKAVFTTVDPGSREVLAEVYAMQPEDVDRAVQAASAAFAKADWAKLPPNDRGAAAPPGRWSRETQDDHRPNRGPRLWQGLRASRSRRAELRGHDPVLRRHGPAGPAPKPRLPSPGTRRGQSVTRGVLVLSSSRGTSRSCWPGGESLPRWLPATPW